MDARKRSLPARLGRFVLERFSPVAYGPLVVALVLAGQAGAALAAGHGLVVTWATAWATAAVSLGFLQLRVLDDLGDAETDRLGRPHRPLPRGLVTVTELRALAVAGAIVGIAITAYLGFAALACYGLALAQIWLLASARRRVLPHGGLVADALVHSLIVPTMLAVAWATTDPLAVNSTLAFALLLAWGAGLALEVGRKTVAPGEERPGIETYSRAIGRPRALALLAGFLGTTAVAAALLAGSAGAVAGVVAIPIGVVGAVVALAVVEGRSVGTAAIRRSVPLLVLGALVWPTLLAWGLR